MKRKFVKEIKDLNSIIDKVILKDEFFKNAPFLNKTQFQILIYIARNEDKEICQKDLEEETHLKKASITGTLDLLEENGIIIRTPSTKDRRKKIITLSQDTYKHKEKISNVLININQIFDETISEENKEMFFEIIETIEKKIEAK